MAHSLIVAHLVRRQEGIRTFERFLASYRRHAAGASHELVLLTKGFANEIEWNECRTALADLSHRRHAVPEDGFDLGAYRAFLPTAVGSTVLFLNSHAEILVDGWLELLVRHAGPNRLIGATGSWNSHRTDRFTDVPPWIPLRSRLRSRLRRACLAFVDAWRDQSAYPPFPNPHIRTNAFLLPPDLHHLIAVWPLPADKRTCHALESGPEGISAAVVKFGGDLLMAGSDGCGNPPLHWPKAGIFCSDLQQHLIIGDNHTREYANADHARRRLVGWITWRSFHKLTEP